MRTRVIPRTAAGKQSPRLQRFTRSQEYGREGKVLRTWVDLGLSVDMLELSRLILDPRSRKVRPPTSPIWQSGRSPTVYKKQLQAYRPAARSRKAGVSHWNP
ncbi:hypothetical protein GCM10010160_19150 [Acrocarpospora corrugata]